MPVIEYVFPEVITAGALKFVDGLFSIRILNSRLAEFFILSSKAESANQFPLERVNPSSLTSLASEASFKAVTTCGDFTLLNPYFRIVSPVALNFIWPKPLKCSIIPDISTESPSTAVG